MAAKLRFTFPKDFRAANERVKLLLAGCSHYGRSDLPMFLAGYNELCRLDLSGGRILEVCCGVGDLAMAVARAFPEAEVIASDRYPEAGRAIREAAGRGQAGRLSYKCTDALQLRDVVDGSLDLVYGQATLHHLAHDTAAVGQEFSRVLKPGGRLVFIYEPLGHNPLWAMIRAYRVARGAMPDESNVVLSQLEEVSRCFELCEIQVFNFLAYPFKSLGRVAAPSVVESIHRLDGAVMSRWQRLAPLAANFNAIFTKQLANR
jgi:SAM-dependent methyltransferase